ncbi:ImmA/IrrE family metallo-endopeptidase, partial [Enterobacter hormaechei]|uniref:ImmA/IrrE family metallo-endopeptidase n=1 Tax=Enterobacter hormaechei TaxID=158836 RepID=UPI00123C0EEA
VENQGAIVTGFDGVSEKVDALSVNRKFPIIIRNTAKESACPMRFDLAHECGHLIMHDGIETGCKKTEREADAFASAF